MWPCWSDFSLIGDRQIEAFIGFEVLHGNFEKKSQKERKTMLYSELKAIHNDLVDYNHLQNHRCNIIVQRDNAPHLTTFNFDELAEDVSSIVAITHASGTPLKEWLEKATVDFYSTIDDAVNGWMARIKTVKGVEETYSRPNGKKTDKHYLWFERSRRTDFDIGLPRLNLDPFSYQKYSTGYGHEGSGFAFPRSTPISALIPTKVEETALQQYNVKYTLLLSVKVTRYELKAYE